MDISPAVTMTMLLLGWFLGCGRAPPAAPGRAEPARTAASPTEGPAPTQADLTPGDGGLTKGATDDDRPAVEDHKSGGLHDALASAVEAHRVTLDGKGLLIACALPRPQATALGAAAVGQRKDTPTSVPSVYNRGLLFRSDADQGSAVFALLPADRGTVRVTWTSTALGPPSCTVNVQP